MIPHALREAWAALEAENKRLRALADAVRAEHAAMRRVNAAHEETELHAALTAHSKAHAAAVAALAALAPPPAGRCIEAEYDYVVAARAEAKEAESEKIWTRLFADSQDFLDALAEKTRLDLAEPWPGSVWSGPIWWSEKP